MGNTECGDDFKAVWVSPSNTPYYVGKNGMITTFTPMVGVLDHFVISPDTFTASTCLANAITITAEDSGDGNDGYIDTETNLSTAAHVIALRLGRRRRV